MKNLSLHDIHDAVICGSTIVLGSFALLWLVRKIQNIIVAQYPLSILPQDIRNDYLQNISNRLDSIHYLELRLAMCDCYANLRDKLHHRRTNVTRISSYMRNPAIRYQLEQHQELSSLIQYIDYSQEHIIDLIINHQEQLKQIGHDVPEFCDLIDTIIKEETELFKIFNTFNSFWNLLISTCYKKNVYQAFVVQKLILLDSIDSIINLLDESKINAIPGINTIGISQNNRKKFITLIEIRKYNNRHCKLIFLYKKKIAQDIVNWLANPYLLPTFIRMIPELENCLNENRDNLVLFIGNFISQYNVTNMLDFTKEDTIIHAIDDMLKQHKDIALNMFYVKYCCLAQNHDDDSNAIRETSRILNIN